MALEFLQGLPELARLVPLVDARQQVLPAHLATHDQVGRGQLVQLRAGAVGAVLQRERQLLQLVLVEVVVAHLHQLLTLLEDHLAVRGLFSHLLHLGLDGCNTKQNTDKYNQQKLLKIHQKHK